MDIITLDFETFYDSKNGYTLRKQTTQQYIDDPRYETIGVAVRINDGETRSFSGTHEIGRAHV